MILQIITHADGSRGCKAFSGVCLVASVCLHDNSKTNDSKVFKLGVGNDLGIYNTIQ